MSDKEFLLRAIEIAKENIANGGGPFGAVIVLGSEIIAEAGNTVVPTNDPTAHAEVNAIRQACQKLKTFELTNAVIYASCEPCPMCLSAIYWAGIKKIYYAASRFDAADAGFDDEFIYKELELPIDKRSIQIKQLSLGEESEPFDIWKQSETKVRY